MWEESAECRDLPPGWTPNLWFPLGPVSTDVRAACDRCPVRRECLITALIREEADGIWAGLSPDQRARAFNRGRATAPPQVAEDAA
ncbi:WhiB family transcriptional regulator [Nocardiopsis sp. CT-R113]|uniref:Transcriptional regulator WhiB n=1 Tax=Nocardiopsis codii TaxID=3065942 RepID=A0ABU7KGY2_9ACTN|nr:WhiB family transcriptional regulator [Nocardiopsis sp. CT-R113]MEE2041257.1 WhiB family transcriptional regulator [Nocardiopsis sp. CT-R113]